MGGGVLKVVIVAPLYSAGPPHINHTYCPLLGFKQPVFLRQTSARGWELLLQSPLLRTLGVGPTQCQSFAEVSYHRYRHSSKSEITSNLRWPCLIVFTFRFKETIIQTCEDLSSAGFDESSFKHHLNTVNNAFPFTNTSLYFTYRVA